ncbi:stalk domain-containing protein [Desertibacillus haloalkaliphilus]|uniref:stalk domain-containing protein n=1 Tax=Desertibacillus haloalkaliphilus TaxID=1328930 RepID=UPI001C279FED|nr:stalk domain-containing protein [Desertibacillus haloalkaliphilus]MBU8905952.1 hypothetical protein [Desertibacillus haloalkaliphilus]
MKHITILLFILLLLVPSFTALAAKTPATVETYAGTGVLGLKDGDRLESQFRFPSFAAVAEDGTVFVSDSKNHLVRKISEDGSVSTVGGVTSELNDYGEPAGGFVDGESGEAMFNEPQGIAVDANDVVYVADSKNGAIRVIENNQVSTLIDGLELPTGLVVNGDGELYVTETLAHRVIKISTNGAKTIVAGGDYEKRDDWLLGGYQDGAAEVAQFNEPTGLALAADDTLYVADTGNQRIRSISAGGLVETVAGTGTETVADTTYFVGGFENGPADQARFRSPHGIAITSAGELYVADTLNHQIRTISDDEVNTFAGTSEYGFTNEIESRASFDHPHDVLIVDNGTVIVVDYWNHSLRSIEPYTLPNGLTNDINVVWDDEVMAFDVEPQLVNNRTMLPIRQIAEAFDYQVVWNQAEKTITFINGEKTITMKIGEKTIDGDVRSDIDIAPFIVEGRTLAPLRFVSEAFEKDVIWISDLKTVLIR